MRREDDLTATTLGVTWRDLGANWVRNDPAQAVSAHAEPILDVALAQFFGHTVFRDPNSATTG